MKTSNPKENQSNNNHRFTNFQGSGSLAYFPPDSEMEFTRDLINHKIQASLKLGGRSNKFEKEADSAAQSVVSSIGSQPKIASISDHASPEEEIIQKKEEPQNNVPPKISAVGGVGETPPDEPGNPSSGILPPVFLEKLNNSTLYGQPLVPDLLRQMESGFGTDLSHVRIHTGQQASDLSQSIHAEAFTYRNNIFFNKGYFNPQSNRGKLLLAHEITHVIQQSKNASGQGLLQRTPLPRRHYESSNYRVRRIVSEINDHLDNGRVEQAQALATSLRNAVADQAVAYFVAVDAAQALIRLGRMGDAQRILNTGRLSHLRSGSASVYSYSMNAARMMLTEGQRHLAEGRHEQSFTVFTNLFRWLENRTLRRNPNDGSQNPGYEVRAFYQRWTESIYRIPESLRQSGNRQLANRYYQRIRELISRSELFDRYATSAAQQLLNAERNRQADSILEQVINPQRNRQEDNTPDQTTIPGRTTSNPQPFAMEAIELYLQNGEQEVAGRNWERARYMFSQAVRWVQRHRGEIDSDINLSGRSQAYYQEVNYRIMGGFLGIINYHIQQAETAHLNNAPEASRMTLRAREIIQTVRGDLQTLLGLTTVVPVARIENRGTTGIYRDAQNPAISLEVGQYETAGSAMILVGMMDRRRQIVDILRTSERQLSVVNDFYTADANAIARFESQHHRRPDIHSIQDRQLFWRIKYDLLISNGTSREDAVQALITNIGNYLRAFTIHTEYNVPETLATPVQTAFPRSIARRALMDCGVYSMRTAYELSLIRNIAQLEFHYVFIPDHVYLAVIDSQNMFGWVLSNDNFRKIQPASNINSLGVAQAAARAFGVLPEPVTSHQISGSTEAGLFRDYRRGLTSGGRRFNRQSRLFNYTQLRLEVSIEFAQVIEMLRTLKNRFEALPDPSNLPPNFREQAIELIEARYPEYVRLSRQADQMATALRNSRGGGQNSVHTTSGNYFRAMYRSMRYLVHVLGQNQFASQPYVQNPGFTNYNQNYQGDPPPWTLFNFNRTP